MKKLLCLIAVLVLAGTAMAHGAALNDGLTRQVYAQNLGSSVVSDKSVMFRLWYEGSGTGTVGISQNSVNLYHNGTLTTVSLGTYYSVERAVDYIEGLSNWDAAIGPDARPGQPFAAGSGGTIFPITTTTTTAGGTKESPTSIYLDSGTARTLSAGVAATENKINRIKSLTSRYAIGSNQVVTILVYDDDTLVWRKDIATSAWNSATAVNASSNTIVFPGDKGIAGSMGKSLVAYVSSSTAIVDDYPMISGAIGHNVSIVYDQF